MPGGLIDMLGGSPAETIAWAILASMAAYFIAHYGLALRERSQNGALAQEMAPTRFVGMMLAQDARLLYTGLASIASATVLWVFNPLNIGAAVSGLAAQIPALWGGFTVFVASLTNASGFTNFPPLWVLGLALAAGIAAQMLRTIEFEGGDG